MHPRAGTRIGPDLEAGLLWGLQTDHLALLRSKLVYLARMRSHLGRCNAVNHDDEDDSARLNTFIERMLAEVAALEGYHQRLLHFCAQAYGLDAS